MRPMARTQKWSRSCTLGLVGVATAALGLAPIASADPVLPEAGSRSAADTISAYEASGFDVDVNYPEGPPNVPLTECKVTAIRNFNGPMASLMMLSAVDVDVACPNAK